MKLSLVPLALLAAAALQAAPPNPIINYQGVLRSSSDAPLTGSYPMVFRFFSAAAGGDEILVDAHTTITLSIVDPPEPTPTCPGCAIPVDRGLFNVVLGSGTITDGGGPGTYTDLAQVFKDYGAVYLEIQVSGETLTPRTQVLSAAYAQSASYAYDAASFAGRPPAQFLDTTSLSQSKSGTLTVDASAAASSAGVRGFGSYTGGYFRNPGTLADAYVGGPDQGITAFGPTAGGYFQDLDDSGRAYVGYYDLGIDARGNSAGGYFADSDSTGSTYAGIGGFGIFANGSIGVRGSGSDRGAEFLDSNQTGLAYLGTGDRGIEAYGDDTAGYFYESDTGTAVYLASFGYAVSARGTNAGGEFTNLNSSAYAWLGMSDRGISATASQVTLFSGGGEFRNDAAYSYVAAARPNNTFYKVLGNGQVSFVQNHPEARDKTIVYAAPEGDEVAVYTRGHANLTRGEARVALGETFRWVTNPDIGLTAFVSPRDECNGIYVASITPTEIVVRESGGGKSDAPFDYMVWGLRVGFESSPIVDVKSDYSPVPDPALSESYFAAHPDLRKATALERFKAMGREPPVARHSRELVAAINRFDPEIDGKLESSKQLEPGVKGNADPRATRPAPQERPREPGTERLAVAPNVMPFAVAEPVERGDLLIFDGERLRPVEAPLNGDVVATALHASGGDLVANVSFLGGVATIKVDATNGAIRPGDPLVSSTNKGHAMRAADETPAGAVVGRALERLDAGAGLIRVLVRAR